MPIYIYIYVYIIMLNYITNVPACFDVSKPFSGSSDIAFTVVIICYVIKMNKTVDRCMIKSVLSIKCGSDCICSSKALFWCVWLEVNCSFYHTTIYHFM
jgi:hypothetical protein